MRLSIFNILILLAFSSPAWAEDPPSLRCGVADTPLGSPQCNGGGAPPLNFKGVYQFQFGGLPFGSLGIEIAQSPDQYAIAADVASEGLVKLFAPHTSHTTVEAKGDDILYDTHYRTRKKKKAVKLVYKDEKIVEEVVLPVEPAGKRPPVPAELKNEAYDPLSLSLAIRHALFNALKTGKNDFSLMLFDGRRLTEVNASIAGKKTILMGEDKVSTIKLALRRKLIAGFTESEKADIDPNEPTLWMYYSDDERLVPLKIEMGFLFGKIVGTLVKECGASELCLLGIRE